MEKKAEELYVDNEDGWCTSQTTIFSRWTGVYCLKYTETGKCSGNSQKVSKAVSESEDTV